MKNATHFLAVLCAIQLGGCAYQPKQVEASRPLVNLALSSQRQALPADLQLSLNTLPQGATLNKNSMTYILGQRYISALGHECVELLSDGSFGHSQRNTACKDEELWYQVPQLEQTSVSNLLAE